MKEKREEREKMNEQRREKEKGRKTERRKGKGRWEKREEGKRRGRRRGGRVPGERALSVPFSCHRLFSAKKFNFYFLISLPSFPPGRLSSLAISTVIILLLLIYLLLFRHRRIVWPASPPPLPLLQLPMTYLLISFL